MYKLLLNSLCVLLTVSGGALSGATLPKEVRFKRDGSFLLGDAEFYVQVYDKRWCPGYNKRWNIKQRIIKPWLVDIRGGVKAGDCFGLVHERITPETSDSFNLSCSLKFRPAQTVNGIYGVVSLPVKSRKVVIDGKEVMLPEKYSQMTIFRSNNVKEVKLDIGGGLTLAVKGAMAFAIQDNRKFKHDNISLRFHFTPAHGTLDEAKIKLNFSVSKVPNKPVNVAAVANRGFVDEKAGDGKGGWSDQGPENDLRAFKKKSLQVLGLDFSIVDPKTNDGKSVLVIGGKMTNALPQTKKLKLPKECKAGAVNLLHASAWTPPSGKLIGHMIVKFADNSTQRIPVISQRDCANWWLQPARKNAYVAWVGENSSSPLGLYTSSFALRRNDPREVTFVADAPMAQWMIVGLNISDRALEFPVAMQQDQYIIANKQWLPLEFKQQVVEGSPLDFSWTLDAPAGKYGNIISAPAGTLTFAKAPDQRIRMFGVNLCFSASFLSKKTADKLADTFARNGYNTVRFHHHDTELLKRNAKNSLTFDNDKLDKLDYLFYVMKKRGLYITTDLYTNRVFKRGDNIPECNFYNQRQMKALIPVSPAAMANWKEFARKWMTHKNPYTGMTWGDDPALFAVNLINEEALIGQWGTTPESIKLYRERFAQWKRKNNIKGGNTSSSDHIFCRFLNELQTRTLQEQIRFVKHDLKLKCMVTSLNNRTEIGVTLMRNLFDLVDNHSYFEHPAFVEQLWRLPFRYRQRSAIAQLAVVPARMMPTRIFGKPFIVTEFNYCNPNIFRAEGGPLMGAYAALQNWDALYRFTWSHSRDSIKYLSPSRGFDAVNSPMAQLADRISIAMFVRRDVKASKKKFSYMISPKMFEEQLPLNYPRNFDELGLIAQIGSNVIGDKLPTGVNPVSVADAGDPDKLGDKKVGAAWEKVVKDKLAVSTTGQIVLNAKKLNFKVVTPLSESITLAKDSLQAGVMSVSNADGFQTVAAISLDRKPLRESKRILVIQLTNVANTKMHFADQKFNVLKEYGKLPLLIRNYSSTVEFAGTGPFKVEALSADGKVRGSVKGMMRDGKFSFRVAPGCFPGGVMAYYLTR